MIYFDVLTGRYFQESEDLVTKLFREFYVDEVKLSKETQEWEFTKTAKIVSVNHYYNWLSDNVDYMSQDFCETIGKIFDLMDSRRICLHITTELSEPSANIIVVLDCRFTM